MSAIGNITRNLRSRFAWQNANLWQDATKRAAILSRFWSNVNRADAKACWLWTGYISTRGYGVFGIGGKSTGRQIRVRAHRLSWLLSRGDIPQGMEVCHDCDNPACVNPDHLYLGTHRENHLDSVRKGRKRVWGIQKLNADDVRVIRQQAARGLRQKDIAKAFGIARNTVSGIVHRKSWAHLEDGSSTKRQAS